MNIGIFDTETTGLPDWKAPSESAAQPHLVEIAIVLFAADGKIGSSFEAIIRPDGWTIPEDISAIHGITTERAMDEGISEADAIEGFTDILLQADLDVAHNLSFDRRIARIAWMRYKGETFADFMKDRPGYCTALKSKAVCQLPPTEAMLKTSFKNTFKTPSLDEALMVLTNKPRVGAHRAMSDVMACCDVYFELVRREAAAAEVANAG